MNILLMPIFICKDLIFRILLLPEFIFSFFRYLPSKTLKIRILILKNDKISITPPKKTEHWINKTSEILKSECNIILKVTDIEILEAPTPALETTCKFKTAFSKNTKIYARLVSKFYKSETFLQRLGYGAPLNVIVTKSFRTANDGCAIPLITNYVVLSYDASPTTLAHEISHIAWLGHKTQKTNIMNRFQSRGTHFTRFQKAMLRTSRYVTWFH